MKTSKEEFGALGSWKKIDERFDETIIKQVNDASCVSAVGEMLARFYGLNISQQKILEKIGEWSNSKDLAEFLNSIETRNDVEWIGGFFYDDIEFIKGITRNTRIWGVMLRNKEALGHAVLIDGLDSNGLIIIKDPFDQTTYKIETEKLYNILSEIVLRRKKKNG